MPAAATQIARDVIYAFLVLPTAEVERPAGRNILLP